MLAVDWHIIFSFNFIMSSENNSISVPKTASAVKPPSTVKTASGKTKTPKTASAKLKVSHLDKFRPPRATAPEQDIPRKGGPKHDCELDDVYAACTMTTEREFVDVLANVLVLETHSISSLFLQNITSPGNKLATTSIAMLEHMFIQDSIFFKISTKKRILAFRLWCCGNREGDKLDVKEFDY